MRWALASLSCAALSACAASIPAVPRESVVATSSTAGLPVLRPCVLVGERHDRLLLEGIADVSLDPWRQAIAAVAVKHPRGLVLFDPSYSRTIAGDVTKAPLVWAPIVGSAATKTPIDVLLEDAGMAARDVAHVALTHAHWDHLGGARDLVRARVHLAATELSWARSLDKSFSHGVMRHHLAIPAARWAPFEMDGPAYEGFERSHDLLGDGTIVAVPLPGHTPGHTGYFLNSGDGKRWFLIGDASWTVEGVKRPSMKNPLAQALADSDPRQTAATLGVLHAFALYRPEIPLVPAHDLAGLDHMPACARSE